MQILTYSLLVWHLFKKHSELREHNIIIIVALYAISLENTATPYVMARNQKFSGNWWKNGIPGKSCLDQDC